MNRLLKQLSILALIAAIAYAVYWLAAKYPEQADTFLKFAGIIAVVVVLAVSIARLIYGKDWFVKLGREAIIGNDLISATQNFLNELPKPTNEKTANFIGHLVYRFTRLGFIGLLVALIPITLLYQQNRLLSKQNEKIDKQNIRLDQQTYLQEAERRSSLVFLFSNIMDAVDKELKEDYKKDKIRNLSPQLIGRITGLSTRLKPYRYLDGDILTTKPLSPERGQLLVSLLGSQLDEKTMGEIYRKSDFSYADLEGRDFSNMQLSNINLRDANLRNAYLRGVDLTNADLSQADLKNADLRQADLRDTGLSQADLKNADLRQADLRGTDLRQANLRNANLNDADLSNSTGSLKEIVTREDLNPKSSIFGANLRGADLRDASTNNTNFENVKLANILISKEKFQDMLKSNQIPKGYQLDSIFENNQWIYYLKENQTAFK